jgi:ORF6N domain-containing protein
MKKELIPADRIVQSIHLLRGQKVILDAELAQLYGVTAKVLNQAVKRNRERFPDDFMFRLTAREMSNLNWSQFVTSSSKHRGKAYRPYAFTEQGVVMLSSVLRSDRAVKVNIAIMRAFVKLHETLESNRELARKFAELEQRVGKQDDEIAAIIDAIRQLMVPPEKPRREIGFHVREKAPLYRARNRR